MLIIVQIDGDVLWRLSVTVSLYFSLLCIADVYYSIAVIFGNVSCSAPR